MFAAGNTRRNNASSFMAPSACYTSSQMTPLARSARPTGLLMDATAAWRHNRCVSVTAGPASPVPTLLASAKLIRSRPVCRLLHTMQRVKSPVQPGT